MYYGSDFLTRLCSLFDSLHHPLDFFMCINANCGAGTMCWLSLDRVPYINLRKYFHVHCDNPIHSDQLYRHGEHILIIIFRIILHTPPPHRPYVFVWRKLSPHLGVSELDHRCLLSLFCLFV